MNLLGHLETDEAINALNSIVLLAGGAYLTSIPAHAALK